MEAQLTKREEEVLSYQARAYTPDEIADLITPKISRETVRKTISNIKTKLGYQKSTELTAYYWCKLFGTSLEDQRKQLISACLALIVVLAIPFDYMDKNRSRSCEKSRMECRSRGRREL